MNNICMKIYTVGNDVLVAACDAGLLGKTLEDGDINFEVSKEFYYGIMGDTGMLERHLEGATIANLVGSMCVKCGIDMGLIMKENVLMIGGVPHAQFALMV